MRLSTLLTLCFTATSAALGQGTLHVARWPTCPLESGEAIRDCQVAYRTFGALNSQRNNAVLIGTWFFGRSDDWASLLGPSGYVDTTRFYTVVVDAFGDGLSSSPSNSREQPGSAFPRFTIADLVEAQHRLVVEQLRLPSLHAVVGYSMGGMQAFEWAVRYPSFARFVVPMMGTPLLAAYDRLLWSAELAAIERGLRNRAPSDSILLDVTRIDDLAVSTPGRINETPPDSLAARLAREVAEALPRFEAHDLASQLRAMLAHDVTVHFGGSLSRAGGQVRARMLVVFSPDDHMVTRSTIPEFAVAARADTLALPSPCGHVALFCSRAAAAARVRIFLEQ